MRLRTVWPAAAVLAAACVLAALSTSWAQRRRAPAPAVEPPPAAYPGRFAVAHATATQVLVLDTATGKVYKVRDGDFKDYSELPKATPVDGPPPEREVRRPLREAIRRRVIPPAPQAKEEPPPVPPVPEPQPK